MKPLKEDDVLIKKCIFALLADFVCFCVVQSLLKGAVSAILVRGGRTLWRRYRSLVDLRHRSFHINFAFIIATGDDYSKVTY